MSLWHMHSEILQGFYASEVYVSADNWQDAQTRAIEAFDQHIKEMEDDYLCNFLINADPGDAEYTEQLADLRQQFRLEIAQKLTELKHLAVIFKRT